jgi:uncharacterized protein YdhG (YjbR/CyaY superfamily)
MGPRGERNMKADATAPRTIDEYVAAFPRDVRNILQRVRETIRKEAPEAEEAMKYRLPTFVLHGNLVHFGAFQRHLGLYPTPSGIEAFKDELARYTNAKGSVQFPFDEPIPYGLIAKIVRFRVAEARRKGATKRARPATAPKASRRSR